MKTFFDVRLQHSWVAAGVGLVGVATKVYSGIKQKHEAGKIAANNKYPQETVPDAALYNQQLAMENANQGLPAQQYATAMKNIQRSRSTALRASMDRRSGQGLVGQIQQNTDDATGNLDVANANARLQNQRTLMGVNNQVAGYQSKAFDWNAKNKYNQNYNYSQQLLGAGNANIASGIDSGASALFGLAGKGLFGSSASRFGGSAAPSRLSAGLADTSGGSPNVYGSVGAPSSIGGLDIDAGV